MNRLTDLLVSFSVALLLHGLLVLGAVWFWTLRPPELRPVFQGGDVSLAVTFVAEARGASRVERGAVADDNLKRTPDAGRQMPEESRKRADDNTIQKPDAAEILTDSEAEMTDDGQQTTGDSLPAVAPGTQAGRQLEADAGRRTPDASLKRTSDDGRQRTDSAAETPTDALRQGVSGAVRIKSEIRPYYPLGARLRGEEGAVTVRVWVNGSGRVSRSEVVRSSGFPALDEAAVDAARRARYVSTQPGAWRAEAETTLTFRFRLTE